jgi:hypothetical protein
MIPCIAEGCGRAKRLFRREGWSYSRSKFQFGCLQQALAVGVLAVGEDGQGATGHHRYRFRAQLG